MVWYHSCPGSLVLLAWKASFTPSFLSVSSTLLPVPYHTPYTLEEKAMPSWVCMWWTGKSVYRTVRRLESLLSYAKETMTMKWKFGTLYSSSLGPVRMEKQTKDCMGRLLWASVHGDWNDHTQNDRTVVLDRKIHQSFNRVFPLLLSLQVL